MSPIIHNHTYIYYHLVPIIHAIWVGENLGKKKDLAGFDFQLQQAMWPICLWTWQPRPSWMWGFLCYFHNRKSIIWNSFGESIGISGTVSWCFWSPWSKSKYWWNPHQIIWKMGMFYMDITRQQHGWGWAFSNQAMAGKSPKKVELCSRENHRRFFWGFPSKVNIGWHRKLDVFVAKDILARLFSVDLLDWVLFKETKLTQW